MEDSMAWRVWKIVWAVLRNLFVIAITFQLFNFATTDFERVLLCLIVLIYESVNWAHTTQIRVTVEESFVMRRLVLNLLKRAGEDTEDAEEVMTELAENYQRHNVVYYINMGGGAMIYLIVVWKLLTTIFFQGLHNWL
jgi:hypothetical protein